MHVFKTPSTFRNLLVDGALLNTGLDVTPGVGVTLEKQVRPHQIAVLTLTNFVVTVTAALDYGSKKLCDLPNTSLILVGAIVDLTAVGAGGFTAEENLDLALGTAATASTTFAGAGEQNIVAKIDGTAPGVVDGGSTDATKNLFIAAGATNDVFVNVATGNIATDGTVTLNGTIKLIYLDLGVAA